MDLNSNKIIPLILSGGSGDRLWPLSRQAYPKQFLKLYSDNSLLQESLLHVNHSEFENPFILTGEAHRFLVKHQAEELGIKLNSLILEPVGRNTAPAIAAGTSFIAEICKKPEAILLVLPSDQFLQDRLSFQSTILKARSEAEKGKILTFGIKPDSPNTNYGYIQKNSSDNQILRFTEKPDEKTAQDFLNQENFFWNAGIFMFKASIMLEEMKKHCPEVLQYTSASVKAAEYDCDFVRLGSESFELNPSISIDYAVMEKATNSICIPLEVGWSDVGSWTSLWEVLNKDDEGNFSKGDVSLKDVKNSYIHSEGRLIAASGIEDLIVIETDDAVMISTKGREQELKQIVGDLRIKKRQESNHHKTVHRPWGSYEVIDEGDNFQVKRIIVRPGERLSLQKHHHRAEHWVVVCGTAEVLVDDKVSLLSENQSVYIPIGSVHRLINPGKIPLHLIEVQSGSYLGEDDIVRFEDIYGRVPV